MNRSSKDPEYKFGACESQKDFNKALRKGIEYNREQDMEEAQTAMWVLLALWLLLIVWALNIVSDMPRGRDRVLHGAVAIVASPAYLISHYLGREQSRMGMMN
jgi:hypothetical protein